VKLKRWIAWGLVSAALIFLVGLGKAWAENVSLPEGAPIVSYLGDKGKINWGSGYIEAVGRGTVPKRYLGKPHARPIALRAAKMDAYRNLMEVVTSSQFRNHR